LFKRYTNTLKLAKNTKDQNSILVLK